MNTNYIVELETIDSANMKTVHRKQKVWFRLFLQKKHIGITGCIFPTLE